MGQETPMDFESTNNLKRRARTQSLPRLAKHNNNTRKSTKYDLNPHGYDQNDIPLPPSTSSTSPTQSPKRTKFNSTRRKPNREENNSRDSSIVSNLKSLNHNNNIQQPITSPKTKPIIVEANFPTINNVLKTVKLSSQPIFKSLGYQKIQVLAASPEDKETIIAKLKSQLFSFYTYTEPAAKPMIYVLKGMKSDFTCDDILADIKDLQLPVIKVSHLINQPNKDPVFLVHFERTNVNLNIRTIQATARYICHFVSTWERFDRARKRITQCRNCQMFGHAASQCHRPYKCVKCTDSHNPGECQRKTKDQEGTPKCVNCQGEHTANSRTCAAYVSYAEKIASHRTNRQNINTFINQKQPNQHTARQPSYAHVLSHQLQSPENVSGNLNGANSSTQNVDLTRIGSLQARFAAIPGITETLNRLDKLVTALENAPPQNHLGILLSFGVAKNASN